MSGKFGQESNVLGENLMLFIFQPTKNYSGTKFYINKIWTVHTFSKLFKNFQENGIFALDTNSSLKLVTFDYTVKPSRLG